MAFPIFGTDTGRGMAFVCAGRTEKPGLFRSADAALLNVPVLIARLAFMVLP